MRVLSTLLIASAVFLLPPPTFGLTLKAAGSTGYQAALQAARNSSAVSVQPFVNGKLTVNSSTSGTVFLFKDGKAFGPVVFGYKQGGKLYSYAQARKAGICKKASARAIMAVSPKKMGNKTFGLTIKDNLGMGYLSTAPKASAADASSGAKVDALCVPLGGHHRLGMATGGARARSFALVALGSCGDASSNDKDHDGVGDNFDADNNNNGTVDNDDAECNDMSGDKGGEGFWMFSNFHLDFEKSLNAHMPGTSITKELIDARLSQYNGLAIQVVGNGQQPVELNCGSLSYCSPGGTGTVAGGPPSPDGPQGEPFPGAPGGSYDPDGDGLGTMVIGNSHDFQLKTNATSDQIQSGNVLVEQVAQADGSTKEYAGMLNYLFWTTPALKTLAVQGGQTYDVAYPVQPHAPGTIENCFHVPASGEAVLTLTLWRPQREGVIEAGEAALMDMGNLRLQANMPNAPQGRTPPGYPPGSAQGPGTCVGNEMTFPSIDSNFTRSNDGIQDHKGDVPADSANTFTYTINISECLKAENNFNGANVPWSSGQTLFLPLQMTNRYGDTAVQNICLVRE